MGSSTFHFPLSLEAWRSGFTRNRSIQDHDDGASFSWQTSYETVVARVYRLDDFAEAHPRVRIRFPHDDTITEGYPRSRLPISEPSPRFIYQQDPPERDSSLTQEEQKKALKKLKKAVYNPAPKKPPRRINLYYRDNNANNLEEEKQENDEEGKTCAICLDDFEPKQEVTLTPCNHMFHDDCILPWVKSHGQCPVCRSAICEQTRQTPSSRYIDRM